MGIVYKQDVCISTDTRSLDNVSKNNYNKRKKKKRIAKKRKVKNVLTPRNRQILSSLGYRVL